MESLGDATVVGIISSVITSILEILKAWIPKKFKDDNGLVFTRKCGKKFHIPNQAVWPLVSLILGIAIFYIIQWDPLASIIGSSNGGEAISGAATALGAQGVYRIKNVAGLKTGGTEETNAQNTGPTTVASPPDCTTETQVEQPDITTPDNNYF